MLTPCQEACSGPLRDAARTQGAAFAELRAGDLRPVVLKDFKVHLRPAACLALGTCRLPGCRQHTNSPRSEAAAQGRHCSCAAAELPCCYEPLARTLPLTGASICCHIQMATRAVKAKVEPQEVVRYEEYDKRHGAKYTAAGVADMDEDDGWGV